MKVPTQYLAVGAILIGTAVGLAMSGCGDTPSVTEAPSPAPTTTSTPGQAPVTVSIPAGAMDLTTDAYGTNPLVVQVGQTVQWTNNDTVSHTVSSDTGAFDSGLLSPGQQFSHTFTEEGDFPYHCNVHPNMTGTVSVVAASPTPSPSMSASPSPSPSAGASPSPSPSAGASPSPSPSPSEMTMP